jgi:hypothetical protein
MATYNLGRILPTYRGTWESSYNYFIMDIVYYNGSSYVAKSNIHAGGDNPSINNNWQIIALKGELSGTLTPAQEQAIINAIMAQGVVIDNNYTHTDNNYTNADKTAVENINYGVLTLKRNDTVIGTFTANQNGSININVPTVATDLLDNDTIQRTEEVYEESSPNINITIKSNECFVFGTLASLDISVFDDIDINNKATWNVPQSEIYFTADSGFAFNYPVGTYFIDSIPTWEEGGEYQIIIKGGVLQINHIKQI